MSLPQLYQKAVIEAFEECDYQEIFSLNFSKDPSQWNSAHINVLKKFLTANDGDVTKAKEQLVKTLEWRKEYQPLKAMNEEFDPEFAKLGVITQAPDKKIIVWNLYGAIKNPGEVFSKVDKFVRWRIGLHERALTYLDFSDPKLGRMDQVHDYMDVSFLRMDSSVRKTSKGIVHMFQEYYPETLSAKYFVNVPLIMMWVFKVISSFSNGATASKFHVLKDGSHLSNDLGSWVPAKYGGKGKPLNEQEIRKSAKEEEEVE